MVDASVLASVILCEPGYEELLDYIKHCYSVDQAVKEVSNAVWKYYVRKLISLDDARRKYEVLRRLVGVNIKLIDEGEVIDDAFKISLENNITVYDALYIALALRRKAPLASLDKKQRAIALKLGMEVLPKT